MLKSAQVIACDLSTFQGFLKGLTEFLAQKFKKIMELFNQMKTAKYHCLTFREQSSPMLGLMYSSGTQNMLMTEACLMLII